VAVSNLGTLSEVWENAILRPSPGNVQALSFFFPPHDNQGIFTLPFPWSSHGRPPLPHWTAPDFLYLVPRILTESPPFLYLKVNRPLPFSLPPDPRILAGKSCSGMSLQRGLQHHLLGSDIGPPPTSALPFSFNSLCYYLRSPPTDHVFPRPFPLDLSFHHCFSLSQAGFASPSFCSARFYFPQLEPRISSS